MSLPTGKVRIPGVVDATTHILEHPEVVADRIVCYANILGQEHVIAGVDGGFSINARTDQVDSEGAWARRRALVGGAERATQVLWCQ